MATDKMDWHYDFGLLLAGFLSGSRSTVEIDEDLSHHKQRLDIVVVREGDCDLPPGAPDGFDNFAAHNSITFKSYQQPPDDWAIKELVGHAVNYRKQHGPVAPACNLRNTTALQRLGRC